MELLKNPIISGILAALATYGYMYYRWESKNKNKNKPMEINILHPIIVGLIVAFISHFLNKNNSNVQVNSLQDSLRIGGKYNNSYGNSIEGKYKSLNMTDNCAEIRKGFYIGNDGKKYPNLDVFIDILEL